MSSSARPPGPGRAAAGRGVAAAAGLLGGLRRRDGWVDFAQGGREGAPSLSLFTTDRDRGRALDRIQVN